MSQAEIGNLMVRLSINSAEFAAGIRNAQGALNTLGTSLKAFATGAGAVSLFSSAIEALHQVADIGDVADSIGITAEQLQTFNRMALASNTPTEIMAKGLQSIAEQSVDANSALSKLFAANGLTTAGKSVNDIIRQFMELLKNARTPAEQLAITTSVLGDKVGRQLVEALRTGSAGWQDEFETMKKSGNYLANSAVADAQRIETAYNQMIANISTGWQRMVVGFAKGLEDVPKNIPQQRYIPGRGPDFRLPVKPNMGPMGGPGQFPPIVVKPTILPINESETDKLKKVIEELRKRLSASLVVPVQIDTSVWDRAEQIIQDTMTPLEQYKQAVLAVNEAYNAGALSTEVYGRAIQKLKADMMAADVTFQQVGKDWMTASEQVTANIQEGLGKALDDAAGALSDALAQVATGASNVKDAFTNMAHSISQDLEQLASELLKSSIIMFLKYLPGLLAGGGGAGISVGGMTFGGLFADGGTLGSGKWGIAGEAGPELIKGPASITPMSKMANQTPLAVTVNNYSQADVRTRKKSDGSLELDVIEKHMAEKLLRGGSPLSAGLEKGYGLRRSGR